MGIWALAIGQKIPNIVQFRPNTIDDLNSMWQDFVFNDKPCYINISRQ
jgi:hypothetical protein